MSNYYIQRGPPCGDDSNPGFTYPFVGHSKTFSGTMRATDDCGVSLLLGHVPVRVLCEKDGKVSQVWPSASTFLYLPSD